MSKKRLKLELICRFKLEQNRVTPNSNGVIVKRLRPRLVEGAMQIYDDWLINWYAILLYHTLIYIYSFIFVL